MSCIKNLTDKNPINWTAAGCPLPTMMGIERRHGKDKPVISKALVRLDGGMFKALEAVREKWGVLDAYKSPGPIQFQGASSDEINFMVQPPDIEELIKNTQRVEEIEKSGKRLLREFELLSELSQSRVQETSTIPGFLEKGNIKVAGIKKYDSATEQVRQMIDERFSALQNHPQATYFVEAQDHLLTNQTFKSDDAELFKFNQELLQVDSSEKLRIGLIYLGRQAPGANNVVDGLLRFQAQSKNVELIGFINGVEGLYKEDFVEMTKESFSLYVNLGGIDYIGRGTDQLRTD